MLDYFSQAFPNIFFWWVMYSFPVICTYKSWIFDIPCEFFRISSWFNATATSYSWYLLSFLLMGFIVPFFYPIRRILSDPLWFGFILWHLLYNKWKQSTIKSIPFIDVSNSIWYLEKIYWKSSDITSSALSLIIISMLSLFEYTTLSSLSLEDIKLMAIINWIFYVSDFLRWFMIYFK